MKTKLTAILRHLRAVWMTADPRTLGLFRIAIGCVGMADVIRRLPALDLFYTRDGVLPASDVLAHPISDGAFSLLFAFDSPAAVGAFFAAALICLALFTVGYRTRTFHVLSLIALTSIHNRNLLVEFEGDWVLKSVLILSLFLPLGARFSLDAGLRSMRDVKEKTTAQLNNWAWAAPAVLPVASVAVGALLVQLSLIYFYGALNKSGDTWRDGTAIYYVLHSDLYANAVGAWGREWLPMWVMAGLTWATVIAEIAAPLLILTPLGTRITRRIALVVLLALHLGVALVINVGVISWVMAAVLVLLVSRDDWGLLSRLGHRLTTGPLIVFYDSDCGVCHFSCRVVKRLDARERITFAGSDWPGSTPPGLDELRTQTVVTWHPQTGKIWTRHHAVGAVFRALPFGFLIAWIFWVPGVSWLLGNIYDRIAANRATVSVWMGLPACGIPRPTDPLLPIPSTAKGPMQLAIQRVGVALRETLLTGMVLVIVWTALATNTATRGTFGFVPSWMLAWLDGPRVMQTWYLFAPEVVAGDRKLVVRAETQDGVVFDPLTGTAPDFGPVPPGFDNERGHLWHRYVVQIANDDPRYAVHRNGLGRWLLRWHERAGEPSTRRIVRAEVFWVRDQTPPPAHRDQMPEVAVIRSLLHITAPSTEPASPASSTRPAIE